MIAGPLLISLLLPAQANPLEPQAAASPGSTQPCVADDTTLCLLHDRIAVTARFRNQHAGGREGVGQAIPFGQKSGFFWFFDPGNVELLVKALDGTERNGSLWIFVGSLSDVEFWVDVTDTLEGRSRTYYNPPGNTYGIVDTGAFASDGVGSFCGGLPGVRCPGELFCDLVPGTCDFADVGGLCVEVGDACPAVVDPVCGCDGVTYGNDCERIRARVTKSHDGECGAGGQFCGGIAGIPCPSDDLICDLDPGSCQVADVGGSCTPRPEACPEIYDPVCGCNGITYANDCFRLLAGAPRDRAGACSQEGDVCGGIAGRPCGQGLVCELPAGSCQVADAAGSCVPQPDGCAGIYDPVCGCNGVTYANDCVRRRAGVAKDHDGACEP